MAGKAAIVAAALWLLGGAATAQTAGSPPSPAATPAPDPVKLALAQTIVGSMMSDEQMNSMFGSVQKMLSSQMINSFVPADKLAQARASDPYFDERMKRIGGVVSAYMKDVMAELGPEMRRAVAETLARRETLPDLQAQASFFSTAAGRHLFDAYYEFMSDPAYMQVVSGLGQRLAARAGDLQAKIVDAVKDLPPPPKAADAVPPPK